MSPVEGVAAATREAIEYGAGVGHDTVESRRVGGRRPGYACSRPNSDERDETTVVGIHATQSGPRDVTCSGP
jgi:hypothetical protein